MTDDVSLTVGQFARLCRLSIKQLRHYDDLGLLPPHHVDDETGYRYYHHDQAVGAVTIAMLRSLGASLPEIGRIITGDNSDATLRAVRDRLDSEARRRQLMAAAVDRILATGLPHVDVSVVRQEAVRLVTVRDVAPEERIGEVTSAAVARLLAALAVAEQAPTEPMIGLFPLDFHDDVTITVGAACPVDVAGNRHRPPAWRHVRRRHPRRPLRPDRGHRPRPPRMVRHPRPRPVGSDPRGLPGRSEHHSAATTRHPTHDRTGGIPMTTRDLAPTVPPTDDWLTAGDEPRLVTLPDTTVLSGSGRGAPGGTEHTAASSALFTAAGVLAGIAADAGRPFTPGPMEGQWWVEGDQAPLDTPRDEWHWHLPIRIPDTLDASWIDRARDVVVDDHRAAARLRLARLALGACVQVMHHGSYEHEHRTLARVAEFMQASGPPPRGVSDRCQVDADGAVADHRAPAGRRLISASRTG